MPIRQKILPIFFALCTLYCFRSGYHPPDQDAIHTQMIISANLKKELGWFAFGTAVALLLGVLLSWPATALTLFMAGYVGWMLYRFETIVHWLRNGAKAERAPFSNGLTDEMVELIHREKKYSRKQKSRYRRSLAQFNNLAASLPDAIIVLDDLGEIRWANPAALKLLNIHPEKDLGQRIDNLVRNPDFSQFVHQTNKEKQEVEIPAPAAPESILVVRKVPSDKHMTVLIAADVTQGVRLREMRKAFVADVSHELRTPLTVIQGYLEILQDNPSLEPSVVNAVNEVNTQSDRMRGIVEDLLELSKLEANPLGETEGNTVNVADMIRAMIAPLNQEALKHDIRCSIDDSLTLLGSENEIYSACSNLLNNAIKYTETGTRIRLKWQLGSAGTAVFEVADNGPGIEARHLSRLSERFYRIDTARSREQGGTGLGLAIVKHVVQRHGGSLQIDSTPGSGSQFRAVFPASRVQRMQQVANN